MKQLDLWGLRIINVSYVLPNLTSLCGSGNIDYIFTSILRSKPNANEQTIGPTIGC